MWHIFIIFMLAWQFDLWLNYFPFSLGGAEDFGTFIASELITTLPTYTHTMPTSAGRTRPIEKLISSLAKCSVESAAYGRCIVADYNNISKDSCLSDFIKLKNCYIVSGIDRRIMNK